MKNKLLLISCIALLGLSACNKKEEPKKMTLELDTATESNATSEESESAKIVIPHVNTCGIDNECDILDKVVNKLNEIESYKSITKVDGVVDMDVIIGDEKQVTYREITNNITTYKNSNGIHQFIEFIDDSDGIESKENSEVYMTADSKYTKIEDNDWTKTDPEPYVDFINLIKESNVQATATVVKEDENYIITYNIGDEISNYLHSEIKGLNISGELVATINKDYLPISIKLTNLNFDMTNAIANMKNSMMSAYNLSEDEINIKFDISLSAESTYSDFNSISDSDVIPSDIEKGN